MAASAFRSWRFTARASFELVLANGRYWMSIAPIVRRELKRWKVRADSIDDPKLRALALSKLEGESFHAEAAAMLATFAPRPARSSTVEAIVALELMFDYLDGLTELPSRDPLREGDRLFGALTRAVGLPLDDTGTRLEVPLCNDSGYLKALSRAVSSAVAQLPAAQAIREVAQQIASRSGEAQTRMHAAGQLGIEQLEQWGRRESQGTGVDWRELVVGSASSVLVVHALIAAGGDDRTTSGDASRIAEAYLPMCVLLTLLDGLVDHEHDASGDEPAKPGYLSLYEDPDELAETMATVARRGIGKARALPNGARHVMLFTGVVAYYSSAPGADSGRARVAIRRVRDALGPLIFPTLTVMRIWRTARQTKLFGRRRRAGEGALNRRAEERRELA
jgi:tetraprenyl-beta-curcumene synthase